ncbi:hypothetical protein ACFQ15_03770 [Sphingomonas hankookensis]|uniref:hypothetical protein n=1 Tax=Sphingomonas hankookensis TaxID=563996 RepID=UPI001F563D2B|nr:hypothetical protein [Sphingomonas hankookensis]
MSDGRQGATLAATLRPRLRLAAAWVIGGAAALFVANLLSYWAIPVVAVLLALCWLGLLIDGLVRSWRLRAAGIPALLPPFVPIVALPFAAFLASHALYWSHVAPSWWLLRSERSAFDRARSGGPWPTGVAIVEQAAPRTAFTTRIGPFGSWAAIVHDPTDRMAAARGWNGGPVAADIANVFGNNTIWCQRLDSHWFHCQFG